MKKYTVINNRNIWSKNRSVPLCAQFAKMAKKLSKIYITTANSPNQSEPNEKFGYNVLHNFHRLLLAFFLQNRQQPDIVSCIISGSKEVTFFSFFSGSWYQFHPANERSESITTSPYAKASLWKSRKNLSFESAHILGNVNLFSYHGSIFVNCAHWNNLSAMVYLPNIPRRFNGPTDLWPLEFENILLRKYVRNAMVYYVSFFSLYISYQIGNFG